MRNRNVIAIVGAVALIGLAARHPSANIEVLTHQASDPSPHRVQAAVDLGLMAFSVLITWTGRHLPQNR